MKQRFINHYTCPRCGYYWEDEWDCNVEDDCPSCGKRHIEPTDWDDISEEEVI